LTDVVFNFTEQAKEEALMRLPAFDRMYIKNFKAIVGIDSQGTQMVEVRQDNYLHSIPGFHMATDDLIDILSECIKQLNTIFRNQSYLTAGQHTGFDVQED
jgi:hypothetical protein